MRSLCSTPGLQQFSSHGKFQPEVGLVGLLDYDPQLRDEIGLRSGAAGGAVVRRDGGSGTKQLSGDVFAFIGLRQQLAQIAHPCCEGHRAISEISVPGHPRAGCTGRTMLEVEETQRLSEHSSRNCNGPESEGTHPLPPSDLPLTSAFNLQHSAL
jgi:hypothetical protein